MVDHLRVKYTFKKRDVFYFTKRVPKDIRSHYTRDRIIICLEYASLLAEELWTGKPLAKFKDYRHPFNIERHKVMSGGFIVETYQCSMWAFETSSSFEETVIKAINRGHDADTCGAVAGMIAGRIYGYKSIPQRWLDVLHWCDRIYEETINLF